MPLLIPLFSEIIPPDFYLKNIKFLKHIFCFLQYLKTLTFENY